MEPTFTPEFQVEIARVIVSLMMGLALLMRFMPAASPWGRIIVGILVSVGGLAMAFPAFLVYWGLHQEEELLTALYFLHGLAAIAMGAWVAFRAQAEPRRA